jgi:hypothetical protein
MSATNRGAVRCEADRYITPDEAISNFLDVFEIEDSWGKTILEPCAGNGAIVKEIRKKHKDNFITAIEIRESERNNLIDAGANRILVEDFFKCERISFNYLDIIISNPPYGLAQEIIDHSFEIVGPNTDIVMLLRLNFLGSQERKDFWNKHPVRQLYPLSKRPSFGTHCKCMFGHKHFYGIDQIVPGRCPECGEKWKSKTTTDATDYGWFVWSNWREPLIKVI